jgi:hypothetical protein
MAAMARLDTHLGGQELADPRKEPACLSLVRLSALQILLSSPIRRTRAELTLRADSSVSAATLRAAVSSSAAAPSSFLGSPWRPTTRNQAVKALKAAATAPVWVVVSPTPARPISLSKIRSSAIILGIQIARAGARMSQAQSLRRTRSLAKPQALRLPIMAAISSTKILNWIPMVSSLMVDQFIPWRWNKAARQSTRFQ